MNVPAVGSIIRIVGGVLLATLGGVWFGAPLAAWLDAQLPARMPFDAPWLGWLVILCSILMIVSAEVSFVRWGGGTGAPNDPPQHLVACGPYRWVRNPLYLSGNALLGGTALVHNSLGLLTLAFVVAIGYHLFIVFIEEPRLEKRYGDAYREYKTRVPRWFPRLPS